MPSHEIPTTGIVATLPPVSDSLLGKQHGASSPNFRLDYRIDNHEETSDIGRRGRYEMRVSLSDVADGIVWYGECNRTRTVSKGLHGTMMRTTWRMVN